MTDETIPKEIAHALEILGLTLPVTTEDLERAKRVQLYTWNPARYSNLTNNPKKTNAFVYSGVNLTVVEQIPIIAPPERERAEYMATKRDKMGHRLPEDLNTGTASPPRSDTGRPPS